jgi:hypothetical protein
MSLWLLLSASGSSGGHTASGAAVGRGAEGEGGELTAAGEDEEVDDDVAAAADDDDDDGDEASAEHWLPPAALLASSGSLPAAAWYPSWPSLLSKLSVTLLLLLSHPGCLSEVSRPPGSSFFS